MKTQITQAKPCESFCLPEKPNATAQGSSLLLWFWITTVNINGSISQMVDQIPIVPCSKLWQRNLCTTAAGQAGIKQGPSLLRYNKHDGCIKKRQIFHWIRFPRALSHETVAIELQVFARRLQKIFTESMIREVKTCVSTYYLTSPLLISHRRLPHKEQPSGIDLVSRNHQVKEL